MQLPTTSPGSHGPALGHSPTPRNMTVCHCLGATERATAPRECRRLERALIERPTLGSDLQLPTSHLEPLNVQVRHHQLAILFHKSDCQQDLRPALLSAQEPLEGCVARWTWHKYIANTRSETRFSGHFVPSIYTCPNPRICCVCFKCSPAQCCPAPIFFRCLHETRTHHSSTTIQWSSARVHVPAFSMLMDLNFSSVGLFIMFSTYLFCRTGGMRTEHEASMNQRISHGIMS